MSKSYIFKTFFGSKFHYKDSKRTILHREDGPAIEWSNGDKEWYRDGKLHREDGPAIECVNGTKSWWINGNRHRTNGPATEWSDGTKQWWVNDKELTEAQFNAQYGPKKVKKPTCEGKVVEVDGVKYKLVKA